MDYDSEMHGGRYSSHPAKSEDLTCGTFVQGRKPTRYQVSHSGFSHMCNDCRGMVSLTENLRRPADDHSCYALARFSRGQALTPVVDRVVVILSLFLFSLRASLQQFCLLGIGAFFIESRRMLIRTAACAAA